MLENSQGILIIQTGVLRRTSNEPSNKVRTVTDEFKTSNTTFEHSDKSHQNEILFHSSIEEVSLMIACR